jgi:hypothetical protein
VFFTFLNKDDPSYPDISLMTGYYPDVVLTYYYNSMLKIPLATYLQLKQIAAENTNAGAPIREWEMFFAEIDLDADLDNFSNNKYLHTMGPYYYPLTNTRIYLCKDTPLPEQLLTTEDLAYLTSLEHTPELNSELYSYYKSRKGNKKAAKNTTELINDINMCLISLREIEKVNRHINLLNKFLEQRYAIAEEENLQPAEPDNLPIKPLKEEERELPVSNLIPFNLIVNRKRKQTEKESGNSFNHDMKVYIIRYREYEKACDRFKAVLENWSQYYEALMDNCFRDIEMAEINIKRSHKHLQVYNTILVKSFIHSIYQDTQTLSTFRHYLETGRAHNLQECMNLYEEECHWSEIKASQERIENTIYFMQGANEDYRTASEHIDQIIKRVTNKDKELQKIETGV